MATYEYHSESFAKHNSLLFSKRFFVAIIIFVSLATSTMLMNGINIAIIEMTSDKQITTANQTITRPAEFQWDPATIGIVTSMQWYAGLFSFGGGFFVSNLGGSTSMVLCLVSGGITTLFTQAALYIGFYLFIASRFLVGLFSCYFMVGAAEVYAKWFPRHERSTLISFCYTGMSIGTMVTYPFLGYLAQHFGWPMVFYVSGMFCIVAALLCYIVVKNRPTEDHWISTEELMYILERTENIDIVEKKVHHRYRDILKSTPVIALCISRWSFVWVDQFIVGSLPLYVKDVTHKTTEETGFVSSIPSISQIIVHPLSGALLDYWKNHTDMALTRIHKVMIGIAFTTECVLFLVAASFSNFTISMAMFVLIQLLMSTISPIFDVLAVSIAPNDASIVAGLTTVTTSLTIIFLRTVTGFMTMNHAAQQWNNCFILASVMLIFGNVIFLKYGSSEAQRLSSKNEDEYRYLVQHQNLTNGSY